MFLLPKLSAVTSSSWALLLSLLINKPQFVDYSSINISIINPFYSLQPVTVNFQPTPDTKSIGNVVEANYNKNELSSIALNLNTPKVEFSFNFEYPISFEVKFNDFKEKFSFVVSKNGEVSPVPSGLPVSISQPKVENGILVFRLQIAPNFYFDGTYSIGYVSPTTGKVIYCDNTPSKISGGVNEFGKVVIQIPLLTGDCALQLDKGEYQVNFSGTLIFKQTKYFSYYQLTG